MLDPLLRLCEGDEGEEGEEGEGQRAPNGTPAQDSTWLGLVPGIEHLRTASDQGLRSCLASNWRAKARLEF